MSSPSLRVIITGVAPEQADGVKRQVATALAAAGKPHFTLHVAGSLAHGAERVDRGEADVLLVALLPGVCQVLDAVEQIRSARPQLPVVVCRTDPAANAPGEVGLLVGRGGASLVEALLRAAGKANGSSLVKDPDAQRDTHRSSGAEAALKESEARYRDLCDNVHDLIQSLDPEGRFLYVNRAWTNTLGYTLEELQSRTVFDLVVPGELLSCRRLFQQVISGQLVGAVVTCFRAKSGDEVVLEGKVNCRFDDAGRPLWTRGVFRDVTEKRQLETQFLRAQRLQNIGVLAGGIAHDLNNVLTPVLLCLESLRTGMTVGDRANLVPLAERSARRAANLVKQILAFARGAGDRQALLRPRDVISELRHLISETFPKNIRYEESVPEATWTLLGEPVGLHQVLLNLCINARDAMPEGGRLRIEADNAILEPGDSRLPANAAPGPYIAITVADTGSGMPPEVTERMFDAFFTTKGEGAGTGLGLSTSLGIVKRHHGFIQFSSTVGLGTVFQVFLPAQLFTAPNGGTDFSLRPSRGRGETVLVVDDEPMIRDSVELLLRQNGFQVSAAQNGREALEILEQHGREIQVVLTDLMMPEMDGRAVIDAIRKRHPHLHVIIASGYPPPAEKSAVPSAAFLVKPYTTHELLRAVHKAVARNESDAG